MLILILIHSLLLVLLLLLLHLVLLVHTAAVIVMRMQLLHGTARPIHGLHIDVRIVVVELHARRVRGR